MREINSMISSVYLGAKTVFTAGTTYDNALATTVTGIDRLGYDTISIVGSYMAGLTTPDYLSDTINIYDCSSVGGSYALYASVIPATIVVPNTLGTATHYHNHQAHVDLRDADQFIKIDFQPNLSKSGTDTATCHYIGILGNSHVLPTS